MSERATLIQALREFPALLTQQVAGLTPAQLTTPYNAPEWTIAQNVHHLADSHMNSYIRFKLIQHEAHPTLKPYQQEDWAASPEATDGDITPALDILRGLHTRWTNLMLTVTDWSRSGYHPEYGTVTLDGLLTSYVNHGQAHLKQIQAVLDKMPR
ncbi:MAG: DinB family protein [Anaerolineae bacterium]|jgi:hypothetical protein|nr:DinB family protein [Anaerolineae bacterium]